MKCVNCGKELLCVGELTSEEFDESCFIARKVKNVESGLDPSVFSTINFTDGQVFEYFRALFDQRAQAEFLKYLLNKKISSRLTLPYHEYVFDDSRKIYIHPQEQ